eukprot:5046367-Karenia_brevis.AAC.1
MCMCKIVAHIRGRLEGSGVGCFVPAFDADGLLPITDISYVDDALFPVMARPAELLDVLKFTLSVIDEAFHMHGLSINYSAGKTELLFEFAGTGADNLRRQVHHDMRSVVCFDGVAGRACSVRVVHNYKHVGTLASSGLSLSPEVHSRACAMKQAYLPMKKRFFKCHRLPIKRRLEVAQAQLLAKGLFHAG